MKNWSLKSKIIALFLMSSTMTLLVGGISLYTNKIVVSDFHKIAEFNVPNLENVGRMRFRAQEANRIALMALGAKTPVEVAEFHKDYKTAVERYQELVKSYLSVPFGEGEEEIFNKCDGGYKKFIEVLDSGFSLMMTSPEKRAEIEEIMYKKLPPIQEKYQSDMKTLMDYHSDMAEKYSRSAEDLASKGNIATVTAIIVGFILSITLGLIFSLRLSKSLTAINESISSASSQTTAAGEELSAASQQLSGSSSEAAASLEETLASLEELSSIVKMNASNSKQADDLAKKSVNVAEKGAAQISNLIQAMEKLAAGSKQIEEIISVIDDIAFQTNLLALNASVEAARAGEQGKGFAVVAEAVRTLSQKSAESAKEIGSLIRVNVDNSEVGSNLAKSSGEALSEILSSISHVGSLNGEIASASQEQSSGIEQILQAMNQLDKATQSNATTSEEVASASAELSSQAVALSGLVENLATIVNGQNK